MVICSNITQGYPEGYKKWVHILSRDVPTFPTHKYPLVGFPLYNRFVVANFSPFAAPFLGAQNGSWEEEWDQKRGKKGQKSGPKNKAKGGQKERVQKRGQKRRTKERAQIKQKGYSNSSFM